MASTYTDLNLRAGPAMGYPILGGIPANQPVQVAGCLAQASWCRVTATGMDGRASGDDLTMVPEDQPVAFYPHRERVKVKTLTYEGDTAGNAAAGGRLGAATGAASIPEGTVTTYVREHPADHLYLDGEGVVGATLPEVVPLNPVPDSRFSHAYVTGVPVLVDPAGRQVVDIVR